MDMQNLVRMANHIGEFFESMPDRPEALEGIAMHIKRFWEPRMRLAIMAHISDGGDGVSDIVREALSIRQIA